MYILRLAYKRLASRPGNSILSILLFAIGCSIISLIIIANQQLSQSIQKNLGGIDLVVGAKGSPLQLILSAVLHADYPTGNINLHEAQMIARNPLIEKSIPLAMGDSYKGYRIIGAPLAYAEHYEATLQTGKWYGEPFEAIIGYNVAKTTGLKTGDQFYGVHGFQSQGHAHDEHHYTVKGIMNPGSGIIDNLILTPVESVWLVHDGHGSDKTTSNEALSQGNPNSADKLPGVNAELRNVSPGVNSEDHSFLEIQAKVEAGEDISHEEMELFLRFRDQQPETNEKDTDREITAMLLFYRSPAANIQIPRLVNQTTGMQAASPAIEVNRLFKLLSFGFETLKILAWIIILISGINLFVNLWNTLRQSLSEIALMRVLGAGPATIFLVMMFQGILIAFSGWLMGVVISRTIMLFLPSFHFLSESVFLSLHTQEIILLYFALFTGFLASLLPAWMAYKTDVHYTLTRSSNA